MAEYFAITLAVLPILIVLMGCLEHLMAIRQALESKEQAAPVGAKGDV